jgi:hypothetical protein
MRSDANKTRMIFKVQDLLVKLKDNRARHAKEHEETLVKYREKMTARLKSCLVQIQEGKTIDIYKSFNFPVPTHHLKSYDCVISMLEMTCAEEVDISAAEFQEYILDDWDWTQTFKTVSSSYSDSE